MKTVAHAALLALPLLAAATPIAGAEEARPYPQQVVGNSQLRDLPTSANGRDYRLYVSVPYDYETAPDKKYPVLYICDGYWDFTLINGFYGNLIYDRVVPHFIIVGFGYQGEDPDYGALRLYDYTPAPAPDDPDGGRSGHAAEFLSVIEKEFIPFIEREYRVDPAWRVLGGSSLGGLFTLYALFEKPGLFQAHIAPSPSVAWANDWLFDFEKRFADEHDSIDARLFMTGAGDEWPDSLAGIKRFHQQLDARDYDGFVYKWRLIDGERHAGTKAESYNRGVRFAFEPLAPKEE